MKRIVVAVLVVLGAVTAHPASAQQASDRPSADDQKQAKRYFDAGARAYFDGDYPRAIVEFKKAYAHVDDPLIMYNVSLAYLKLGNLTDALAAARSTARDAERLRPDDRVRFEARWAALGRANVAVKMAKATPTTTPTAETPVVVEQTEVVTQRERFGTLGAVGAGVALVGGGALITATIMDVLIGPDLEALRTAARQNDEPRYDELKANLERRQLAVKVLLVSGAATTLTGLILFAVDLATVREEVVPVVQLHRGTPTFGFIATF